MDQLRVRLFGGLEVYSGETLLPGFATEKSRDLFAFLVLNRDRTFHRDVLCGRFWGEQRDTHARRSLRTALWRIRSVVEPSESLRGTVLRVEGQQVGFPGTEDAWDDASAFTARLSGTDGGGSEPIGEEGAQRISDAVHLYRGELLEGSYRRWCEPDRERLRTAYLNGLERLVDFHRSRGEWLEAIGWGRQLLREDPLREHIHRAVMECHLAKGDRPSALRQYGSCIRILREELDIEPMEETVDLYERARAPRASSRVPRSGSNGDAHGPENGLTTEVDEALSALYALAERLEKARSAMGGDGGGGASDSPGAGPTTPLHAPSEPGGTTVRPD